MKMAHLSSIPFSPGYVGFLENFMKEMGEEELDTPKPSFSIERSESHIAASLTVLCFGIRPS